MAHLKFRHRIGLLVALAASALLAVTIVTLVLGRSNQAEVTGIETRYVPLIELDRDLKRVSADVTKALEDAAGAGEDSKLAEADQLKDDFVRRVQSGRQAILDNGGDPDALAAALQAYYTSARHVSAELVAGTPAGQLAGEIESMRKLHTAFVARLDASSSPDRARLAAAFAAARHSLNVSLVIVIAVACTAFAVMVLVSWGIIRRTVRSLQEVSRGIERLARGDFAQPVEVPAGDEIGDLAHEANRTRERLRDLREEADREAQRAREQLDETRKQARAAETANKELEAFSYSVSHDLRAPLRGIDGFSQALVEDEGEKISPKGHDYLKRIRAGAQRMAELIDDMLRLSRVSRGDFKKEKVDLTALVKLVAGELKKANPERTVEVVAPDGVTAHADARLIRIVLENLLGNAWKFTGKTAAPRVELGVREEDGERIYFVRDNGAGFDMKYADRLFGAFQRLHSDKEYSGTGIGLATCQRIVVRHGGRIWADAAVGTGATFQFTLPEK